MKVQIIIGSTRPGRVSKKVAYWVANELKEIKDVNAEMVDLADYNLPMLDEPISPQYNPSRKPNAIAQKFLNKISEADAYILVTPEYNRSTSAVLKNALDYIDFQFAKKPVALVAHGSTGGAQAVSHLRGILPALKAVTTPSATYLIGGVASAINDDGVMSEDVASQPYGPKTSLQAALQELKWYSDALAAARANDA